MSNIIKKKAWALWLGLIGTLLLVPGLNYAVPPQVEDVLEKYIHCFPDSKSIGIIYSEVKNEASAERLEQGARKRNVSVIKARIGSIKDLPAACQQMQGKVDTIWVLEDPVFNLPDAWSYFILYTMRNKIKTVVSSEKALQAGGLFFCSENKELKINKKIMDVLKLKVAETAEEVKYVGADSQ